MENTPHAKKTVRTFALASFLNDFGGDMIHPVWPLFLTQVIGVNMAVLGLIEGVGDAVVSLSQALSGYWADRLKKRKIFIWTGYLLSGLARFGYAVGTTWPVLLVYKIMDRFGKLRDTPRDAIVADISDASNRGANFGLIRTMDNLGSFFAIGLSIVLIRFLPLRTLFAIAAVPSLIGAFVVYRMIHDSEPIKKIFNNITVKGASFHFKWFLTLSAIFAVGTFSYSFLLVMASAFGFSTPWIPVLYLVFNAVSALSSFPFGWMSDRIGRKEVVQISFILWACTCALIIVSQTHLAIIGAFVIYGLHKGSIDTVQRAYVAELGPEESRASTLGGFKMVTGLSALPSSLIAGFLWQAYGVFIPLYGAITLAIIASVMLYFTERPGRSV